MKVLAIIPARAGSKRLKNKNRLTLGGEPLVNWSVKFALKTKFINDIIISTDDNKIIQYYKNNSKVKVFKRPRILSGSKIKTIKVLYDVIKKYEKTNIKINTIILLQATSPFRSNKKINTAFRSYKNFKMKRSIVSVSKSIKKERRSFIILNRSLKISKKNSKKQKYQMNGNFYIASKNFLKKNKSFFHDKNTVPIILNSKRLNVDIDTKKEYIMAKKFLKR